MVGIESTLWINYSVFKLKTTLLFSTCYCQRLLELNRGTEFSESVILPRFTFIIFKSSFLILSLFIISYIFKTFFKKKITRVGVTIKVFLNNAH